MQLAHDGRRLEQSDACPSFASLTEQFLSFHPRCWPAANSCCAPSLLALTRAAPAEPPRPHQVIPALLVHRQRLLRSKTAPELWRRVGLGILRSSLFLSLYCALVGGWAGVGRC